ncbi:TrkH family potassium uptake protein [Roseovarius sp. LXJ103]|uniref:TrkH family potassium uptake protein n=1 Tax=Roseovarius carneus TaxID=2853164 RepID=UPI000D6199D3|nr:potassium transporter TrkG [Roseovarius carneus]MBZ8119390.1 TrkH family potassium uptake protein [Roseovarius carneus]PWE34964.1 potassium transporter TrkH [Pelagicola sp. LXJ1103]
MPLILILAAFAAAAMFVPALHALLREDHTVSRAFAYSGVLGLVLIGAIAVAISNQKQRESSDLSNLLSLFLAFAALPVFLAIPFYEGLRTTSFLNAYFEMVSSLTTTGATMFDTPRRLPDSLHLWRGMVGWAGGLLIWVAALAVLAPLNLGGFEVTASAEPGQGEGRLDRFERAHTGRRMASAARTLAPIYIGLTGVLWLMLTVGGDRPLVALIHAMSTLSTSGISAVGGVQNAGSGVGGEIVIFFFMFFALSRLTFSTDTITTARPGVWNDPEFRLGVGLVIGVPLLLFSRHWIGAWDDTLAEDIPTALKALWGGMFSVMSFLSTTGFQSAYWPEAQGWSGLGTPGLILLGLALVGGGVATTAGGVKLLRVYALYLNGQREMERLVHPSSVGRKGARSRRIRRQGAFVAWVFFMLFALSLAALTVILAALGVGFEEAIILSIAALSTTGPLTQVAGDAPIMLALLAPGAKLVLCAGMVLGRLELLAIIALLNPGLWRD